MRLEHLLVAAVVIYVIAAFARAANRSENDNAKPSWLVRAWNASGARPVDSPRVGGASAELIGRAAGAFGRRIGELTGRAARTTKDKLVETVAETTGPAMEMAKAAAVHAATRAAHAVTEAALRRWEARRAAGTGDGPAGRTSEKAPEAGGDADLVNAPEDSAGEVPAADRPPLPIVPEEDTDMTAQTTAQPDQASTDISAFAPPDWQNIAMRVADFQPESDADLINFMTAEVAGICGYAEAYEALHEQCLNTLGLDPNSVQGLGEFAEHVMDLTRAMTAAHKKFVITYQEVLQAVANGVVLPYNGRWMTGTAV